MGSSSGYGLIGAARKAAAFAADLVWPPLSPLGEAMVDAPGRLDAASWSGVHFLEPPWCALCGAPFPYPVGEGAVCAPCAAKAPRCAMIRAAFVYDDGSRRLVLDLKYGGRTDTLPVFAAWMARAGAEALAGADRLIPVPLHPGRLFSRRFNQSALLAQALGRRTGLPFDAGVLRRVRATPIQGGKSAKGRRRNVAGAFAVRPEARARIAGETLVLIDDVLTTGATLNACARTLKLAGAGQVNAIALSRVVRPAALPA